MTNLQTAIEDVRMTIVSAEAVDFKQAVFNVESVHLLLIAYDLLKETLGER